MSVGQKPNIQKLKNQSFAKAKGLVAMIGRSGVDSGDAIELLGEKEGGQFVLENQIGEREHVVGRLASRGEVPVGGADEVADLFNVRTLDPSLHLLRKLSGGGHLASFIQNDAKASL